MHSASVRPRQFIAGRGGFAPPFNSELAARLPLLSLGQFSSPRAHR